jgi:Uma2 family endonuclease
MVQPARKPEFTYADVLTWPETERWELIDGVAYDMTPAPNTRHQSILGELHLQLGNALRGAPCRAFVAPFDVRLPRYDENATTASTVVQPDIAVICDPSQLDEHGAVGAPTLVIEIVSPSTASRDMREKRRVYERAGVQEYWVVFPLEKFVNVFLLDEHGRYGAPVVYADGETAPLTALPDVTVDLTPVFAEA